MSYKIGKIKVERTMVVDNLEVANPPIIATENLDTELYDDITSIENWFKYGDILCTDTLQLRARIVAILDSISWSGTTDEEKDIIIRLHSKETSKAESIATTEKIVYLMGKGYTQAQAQGVLIQSYADYHLKEIISSEKRGNSEKLYQIIAKYLTLNDAGDLIKISHKLFDLYKTQGIRGVNDGNAGEGLFDFLESTVGTSYETTGLVQQGYTLNTGDYTSFISELMDVLRNGNY